MDFRILGPLEVSDDGRSVEVRSPKQRALLAILLLRAGEWASADTLIEALWGGRPPATARFALHNYIAGLRRVLGHSLIVSREGGYQLALEADQLDLDRFERLVEQSRAAQGRERIECLQRALALWRGPALADLLYEPFAADEARRLEELRANALEELADAELGLGGGPELVAQLEALVEEQPYRERLRGQLMLALYRSGRQVEALECYRQTRMTFIEELGIEPGEALRELEQAILRQDPWLQAPATEPELPPLAERRRRVTALFAELLLSERLDPELERAQSMQGLARARAVLEVHGATIEQRASEELLALFGLPLAHEDDALRAARAALELQAEPGQSELRLALESGEVLAGLDAGGHGFVTGAAVTAAKHLLERARPGEVLVGEEALGLLGGMAVTEPHEFRRCARLASLDEQALVTTQAETPLAGRRSELAVLHDAFSRAVEERRARLILLVGEAGIGKTRLAAELTSDLEGQATIARGRCLSYGQALSYWPLVEVLRSLGKAGRSAVEQLTTGGATSPLQLDWTVQQALARAAAERPLLVLLEDVHWAEPALLELVELVCEHTSDAPILFLCLARSELLEQRPAWTNRDIVLLGPLPHRDSGSLLSALAEPPRKGQRERVLDRAAGNPLFLEELSAFLAQGGQPDGLPPRLQVLLQARLDQLPERERLLLSYAALEGTVFHRRPLGTLLAGDQELEGELERLVSTRLIQRAPAELVGDEGYRFRHELIRDTAYAELPKAERARLHEHFADWLARNTGERAELEDIGAYHLEQSALIARELDEHNSAIERRASEALAGVAERAGLRVDRRAAADLWRRALALLGEDDPRVPELELELALTLTPLAEFREAIKVLEDAEQRAADLSLAARIRVAHLHVRLFHDPEGVPDAIRHECEEAIPLFERRRDHRALAYAWFALAEAEWFELQVDAATRAFNHAARHAELAGDLARQLLALELRTFYCGTVTRSYAASTEEAEQILVRFHDDPIIRHSRELGSALIAYEGGDIARARLVARDAIGGIDRWGYPIIAAANKSYMGALELLNGQLDEAERFMRAAIVELEQHEERPFLSRVKAQLASLRVAQGRYQEALDLADEAERLAGRNHRYGRIHAEAARARAHLGLAEIEQAQVAAAEALAVAETSDSPDYRATAQLVFAEVLAAAEEFPSALAAAREALRLWTQLDRKLLRRRAAALIEQIQRASTRAGDPTPAL